MGVKITNIHICPYLLSRKKDKAVFVCENNCVIILQFSLGTMKNA